MEKKTGRGDQKEQKISLQNMGWGKLKIPVEYIPLLYTYIQLSYRAEYKIGYNIMDRH